MKNIPVIILLLISGQWALGQKVKKVAAVNLAVTQCDSSVFNEEQVECRYYPTEVVMGNEDRAAEITNISYKATGPARENKDRNGSHFDCSIEYLVKFSLKPNALHCKFESFPVLAGSFDLVTGKSANCTKANCKYESPTQNQMAPSCPTIEDDTISNRNGESLEIYLTEAFPSGLFRSCSSYDGGADFVEEKWGSSAAFSVQMKNQIAEKLDERIRLDDGSLNERNPLVSLCWNRTKSSPISNSPTFKNYCQ